MTRCLLLVLVVLGGCGTPVDAGAADARAWPEDAEPVRPDGDASDAGSELADAAPADAAPADAGRAIDAGAEPECDALLCDGFESGEIDAARWMVIAERAEVRVDDTRAAHGRYALHVTAEGAASNGIIRERATFPVAGNAFYVRAYVWLARPLPITNFNVITAAGTIAGTSESASYRMGGQAVPWGDPGAPRVLRANYQPLDRPQRSATEVPRGRWACWEWHVDGANDAARFWLDGERLRDLDITRDTRPGPWTAPEYGRLDLGFGHGHDDPAERFEVWIDDVVVSTTRIGCEVAE